MENYEMIAKLNYTNVTYELNARYWRSCESFLFSFIKGFGQSRPPRFEKLCFENNGFNVLRSELTDLNPLTLQNSFLFTIIMPIE